MTDERSQDTVRNTKDLLGISLIIRNRDTLDHSMKRPICECDGTFNTVSKMSCDGVDFELNTIIAKDKRTGKCYAVMRGIASRKTKAARKYLLKYFVKLFCENGLENTLQAKSLRRMAFTTYFETPMHMQHQRLWQKCFRQTKIRCIFKLFSWNLFVFVQCARSQSDSKKVDKCSALILYRWAIRTRNARKFQDVDMIIAQMSNFGHSWMRFSN